MTPSPYQLAIYDWVERGTGNAVVDAVAGAGKTTTLQEVCARIPRRETVRLFTFNKPIADTFKGRLPSYLRNVTASTYHSGGFVALIRHFGAKVDVDKRKWWGLMDQYLSDVERKAYGGDLVKLIDYARNQGVGIEGLSGNGVDDWLEILETSGIEFDLLLPPARKILDDADFDRAIEAEKVRVCQMGIDLLKLGVEAAQNHFEWSVDFTDQLYLPLLWDLQLPQYDWVLVDEAQDTNKVQRALIRKSLKPGGRLLAVGDPRQAIYAWRGASHDAMDLIQEEWGCRRLPLSVCYRCRSNIVAKAQGIVPEIEAAPDAEPGEVQEEADLSLLGTLTPQDAILCRNNAPLVETAYALIAQGVPVRVLGREIGDGLRKLISKLAPQDIRDLEEKLVVYEQEERARYERRKEPQKVEALKDKVACLRTIIDNLPGTTKALVALEATIEGMFGDPKAQMLTLSSIHKAKGKEWRTVAVIREWLIPSRWAQEPLAIMQEKNLLYVAWTRAQERLLIMDDKPQWLKDKEERMEERGEVVERWGW